MRMVPCAAPQDEEIDALRAAAAASAAAGSGNSNSTDPPSAAPPPRAIGPAPLLGLHAGRLAPDANPELGFTSDGLRARIQSFAAAHKEAVSGFLLHVRHRSCHRWRMCSLQYLVRLRG
jgi:hypothetical protein